MTVPFDVYVANRKDIDKEKKLELQTWISDYRHDNPSGSLDEASEEIFNFFLHENEELLLWTETVREQWILIEKMLDGKEDCRLEEEKRNEIVKHELNDAVNNMKFMSMENEVLKKHRDHVKKKNEELITARLELLRENSELKMLQTAADDAETSERSNDSTNEKPDDVINSNGILNDRNNGAGDTDDVDISFYSEDNNGSMIGNIMPLPDIEKMKERLNFMYTEKHDLLLTIDDLQTRLNSTREKYRILENDKTEVEERLRRVNREKLELFLQLDLQKNIKEKVVKCDDVQIVNSEELELEFEDTLNSQNDIQELLLAKRDDVQLVTKDEEPLLAPNYTVFSLLLIIALYVFA